MLFKFVFFIVLDFVIVMSHAIKKFRKILVALFFVLSLFIILPLEHSFYFIPKKILFLSEKKSFSQDIFLIYLKEKIKQKTLKGLVLNKKFFLKK